MLLLVTGELIPSNVIGFCIAASNAFGLIAGKVSLSLVLKLSGTQVGSWDLQRRRLIEDFETSGAKLSDIQPSAFIQGWRIDT